MNAIVPSRIMGRHIEAGLRGQNYGDRFNGHQGRPMTDEEIFKAAPAVFAEHAHESRSDRFAYIDSRAVLAAIRAEGWEVTAAAQSSSRIPGKELFTRHALRLRRADAVARAIRAGDVFPEVTLINASDGTSRYHLYAGLLRVLCLNGMVASKGSFGEVHVSHTGNIANKVVEGTFTVLSDSVRALDTAETWGDVQLAREERDAYAEAVHVARFGDEDGGASGAIRPAALLIPRRSADGGNDLWSTFQVAQENSIRGGLTGRGTDANGRRRDYTTRAIKSVDGDTKLNQALWRLTERMAAIKAGNAPALAA